MNVCGIKEHLFRAPLNKKIMVITSIVTLIFDIFSGGVFLRQHGINVRNVFKNIELCLGCNIMTSEHVLGLM